MEELIPADCTDLTITTDAGSLTEDEEDQVCELETTSRSELVSAAYFAIVGSEEVDAALLGKEYEKMKRRILKKSLRIIDCIIGEMHDELFEDEEG